MKTINDNSSVDIVDAEIISEASKVAPTVTDTEDGFSVFLAEDDKINIMTDDDAKDKVGETSIVKVFERSIVTSAGLPLGSQRLLRVILSLITPQDKSGKRYSFYVDDYKTVFNIAEYPIQQLKAAAIELLAPREFNTSDNQDEFMLSGLISDMQVKGGVATFSIAPHLLPVYQSLKEKNQYLLGYTRDFSCSYSFAFYELFLERLGNNTENPNSVTIYYTLEKLQSWLKLGNKYMDPRTGRLSYAGFKRKVLLPVMNDINRTNEDGPLCNINFEMLESKAGRRVVGVEFSIWRTSSIIKEQPIVNKFYSKLNPDTKLAYDGLIALDIKQSEIETCIIKNKESGFLDICHYIGKLSYKSRAYISSILRNGITDFDPNQNINIKNIYRAYNISDADKKRYDDAEEVLRAIDSANESYVCKIIKKRLLTDEPYIYKHLDNLSLPEILDTKDIKIFFLEMFIDILLKNQDKKIVQIYQDYFFSKKQIVDERDVISDNITEVFEKYGIRKNVWKTLANYPENYIMANVNYCVEKYKIGKGQSDIAGVIIQAIKNDYANFNIKKREDDLNQLKIEHQKDMDAVMSNLFTNTENQITHIEQDQLDNENSSEIDEIEQAYLLFISEGNPEDKEKLKLDVIKTMPSFQKNVITIRMKNDNVAYTDLTEIPLDILLKSVFFNKAFKQAFIKEMGF